MTQNSNISVSASNSLQKKTDLSYVLFLRQSEIFWSLVMKQWLLVVCSTYIALTTNKTLIRRLHDAKSDRIAKGKLFYSLTLLCIEIDTYSKNHNHYQHVSWSNWVSLNPTTSLVHFGTMRMHMLYLYFLIICTTAIPKGKKL